MEILILKSVISLLSVVLLYLVCDIAFSKKLDKTIF